MNDTNTWITVVETPDKCHGFLRVVRYRRRMGRGLLKLRCWPRCMATGIAMCDDCLVPWWIVIHAQIDSITYNKYVLYIYIYILIIMISKYKYNTQTESQRIIICFQPPLLLWMELRLPASTQSTIAIVINGEGDLYYINRPYSTSKYQPATTIMNSWIVILIP